MAAKYLILILSLFLVNVNSVSLWERSYDYVRSLAPSIVSILDCLVEEDPWTCAKTKAGLILSSWDEKLNRERTLWQEAADAEARSSGRSLKEMPSQIGTELESTFSSIAEVLQQTASRALARKKESGGGIDSITISATSDKKMKKKKKKKQKPPKIHLIHPVMMAPEEKGRTFNGGVQSWVIGHEESIKVPDSMRVVGKSDESSGEGVRNYTRQIKRGRTARGMFADIWAAGEKAIDAAADYAVESDNVENGVTDKSTFAEQRGKKKKKKKAILKLLILGAVLKAKIGTLLQILSFKLQVKFFIIALIGLGINLARFWLDLKKQHSQPPQKVIYYEHAQHQHHYDHEEEPSGGGWGPWSRSIVPQDAEIDPESNNSPYRGQEFEQYFTEPRKI